MGNGQSNERTEADYGSSQPENAAAGPPVAQTLEAPTESRKVVPEPATDLRAIEEDAEQVSADSEPQIDEVDEIDGEDEENESSLRSSAALDLEESGLDNEQIEELRNWARRHSRRNGRS